MLTLTENQRTTLKIIQEIQQEASIDVVEDTQLAERTGVTANTVQSSLEALAEAGYVELEKVDALSGTRYLISLTEIGQAAV
ncbi:MAG: winged helix-turn-helix domain-containing protein [Anaerolineae bacterium]|nr:winged helix-turn-helix domain-containing protein [Anaerolineae bacterium]